MGTPGAGPVPKVAAFQALRHAGEARVVVRRRVVPSVELVADVVLVADETGAVPTGQAPSNGQEGLTPAPLPEVDRIVPAARLNKKCCGPDALFNQPCG